MSSYRQILYHIVFRTKNSKKTLSQNQSIELYQYMWGFLKNKKCHLYRINGMEDHVHILCELNPTLALSSLIRDLKTSTSLWIKQNKTFTNFEGWSDGYAGLSCSYKEKDRIINYIKNQQEHHKQTSFIEEYRKLIEEHGIHIDEKYFP
jgi:putative transposase